LSLGRRPITPEARRSSEGRGSPPRSAHPPSAAPAKWSEGPQPGRGLPHRHFILCAKALALATSDSIPESGAPATTCSRSACGTRRPDGGTSRTRRAAPRKTRGLYFMRSTKTTSCNLLKTCGDDPSTKKIFKKRNRHHWRTVDAPEVRRRAVSGTHCRAPAPSEGVAPAPVRPQTIARLRAHPSRG
jgi:hypothetical protein